MSAVSGALGANAQKNAARDAANATRDASAMQVEASQKQYDQTRADYQPYRDLGQSGLDNLYGKAGAAQIDGITNQDPLPGSYADAMSGVAGYADTMGGRGFDETMAGYDPATAVERERKLGLQQLGNSMASRGIRGMSAVNKMGDFNDQKEADLSNRQLDFNTKRYSARQGEGNTLYANLRNEATQKYQGAVNDWQLKKAANEDRYNNLLKLVDVGRGATGNVSAAGQSNTQNAIGAIGQMGQATANNAMASGQATAQLMKGIGQTGTQIAGAALKNWGSSNAPATSTYTSAAPSSTASASDIWGGAE